MKTGILNEGDSTWRKRGRSELSWCIDMLGRTPALATSDTLAQRGFDLLPESVIAQGVIVARVGCGERREPHRSRKELDEKR
jgi:hypothetical protein